MSRAPAAVHLKQQPAGRAEFAIDRMILRVKELRQEVADIRALFLGTHARLLRKDSQASAGRADPDRDLTGGR